MAASHRLVKWCYAIDASQDYRRIKQFFRSLIDDPRSPMRPYFDMAMIALVVTSVFVIIWQATGELGPGAVCFSNFALMVFAVEYCLRVWIYSDAHKIIIDKYEHAELLNQPFAAHHALWAIFRDKWSSIKTPKALIDLLAILPSFRAFGFLRFLLLFRLLKVFRYARSLNEFAQVLNEKRFELYTLAMFSGFVATCSASYVTTLSFWAWWIRSWDAIGCSAISALATNWTRATFSLSSDRGVILSFLNERR